LLEIHPQKCREIPLHNPRHLSNRSYLKSDFENKKVVYFTYMEYQELKEFDEGTKKLMVSYMKKAGIFGLNSLNNFEKFLVALIDDFMNYKLSTDDFSVLCGKLLQVLEKNDALKEVYVDEMQLQNYLLMGDEITWYLRYDPVEAGESIKSLIDLSDSLKRKLFDDEDAMEKYPFLELLDKEERRLIFEYLRSLGLAGLTETEDVKKLFVTIMPDFMRGNYHLKDILNLCNGFRKLLDTQFVKSDRSEFIQELMSGLKNASQQTTEPEVWWQNARQLVELYKILGKRQTTNKNRHLPPLDANRGNDPRP